MQLLQVHASLIKTGFWYGIESIFLNKKGFLVFFFPWVWFGFFWGGGGVWGVKQSVGWKHNVARRGKALISSDDNGRALETKLLKDIENFLRCSACSSRLDVNLQW